MDGDALREHLRETLNVDAIRDLVDKYGVQERERKLNVFEFLVALILAGGTHEGGRQYDILRTYLQNGAPKIRCGTFYSWFTEPLLRLLTELLDRAIAPRPKKRETSDFAQEAPVPTSKSAVAGGNGSVTTSMGPSSAESISIQEPESPDGKE